MGDQWQHLGVAVDEYLQPPAGRQTDEAFNANFPAFKLSSLPNGMATISNMVSSQAPVPENGYTGSNPSRYQNPEFDALIDRYLVSLDHATRINVAQQIIHQMSDQVLPLGLFYTIEANLVSNHIENVVARAPGGTHAWNASQWDLRA